MVERFGIKYNHEQEFQADEAAYDVMMFLKAKPDAYVSALTKIRNYLYRTGNHLVLKDSHTHPSLDSRLEKLAVIPKEFYSEEYQRIISFVNTNNAKIEYSKKHFLECENLVDKNINAGVGTESDYILKALVTRVIHGDKKNNLLALDYLNKAEELGIEPNAYIDKQKAITYLRLNQTFEAKDALEQYLNQLSLILGEENEMSNFEEEALNNEISWTKKMIYKLSSN